MISTQVSGKILRIKFLIRIRDIEVVGIVGVKDITGRSLRFHKLECLIVHLNVLILIGHDKRQVSPLTVNQFTICIRDDIIAHQRPSIVTLPCIKAELSTGQIHSVIVFIYLVSKDTFNICVKRGTGNLNGRLIGNGGDLCVFGLQGGGVAKLNAVARCNRCVVAINHDKRRSVWQGEGQPVGTASLLIAIIPNGFVQIRILRNGQRLPTLVRSSCIVCIHSNAGRHQRCDLLIMPRVITVCEFINKRQLDIGVIQNYFTIGIDNDRILDRILGFTLINLYTALFHGIVQVVVSDLLRLRGRTPILRGVVGHLDLVGKVLLRALP